MSVAAAPPGWFSNRRNVALAALFAIALSLAIAIGVYNRGGFRGAGDGALGDAARNALNQGVNALGDTVAGLFGSRSPGERAEGLHANMKHRMRPALHQRALPKVRGGPPAGIVGAPPLPPVVPPAATPLYNAVTGAPKAALPGTPSGFTPTPGGPSIFPGFSPPGGGGVIVPPPVTISPPETPGTPTTPTVPITPNAPVPEPASWLMMLLGFMVIGRILRRDQSASLLPT
jgi:hypothetical protein